MHKRWWQGLAGVATVLAVVGLFAAPAAADSYGGYATADVNVRDGAGASGNIIDKLPKGTQVHIYCTLWSTVENGSPIWDYIGSRRWVSDAYVNTGYDVEVAQSCNSATAGGATVDVHPVAGCGMGGSYADPNFGAQLSVAADWYYDGSGECVPSRYAFTYGNGPTPSGDFAKWGYYPGAYATCTLTAFFPPKASGVVYDSSAFYQVFTGSGHTAGIASTTFDQNTFAGGSRVVGTFTADGSGYLGIELVDSSQSSSGPVRVVAGNMRFHCTIANV